MNTASTNRVQATVFCHIRHGHNESEDIRESRRLVNMYEELKHVRRVYLFIDDGYRAVLSGRWAFDGLRRERRLREILDGAVQQRGSGKFQISLPDTF